MTDQVQNQDVTVEEAQDALNKVKAVLNFREERVIKDVLDALTYVGTGQRKIRNDEITFSIRADRIHSNRHILSSVNFRVEFPSRALLLSSHSFEMMEKDLRLSVQNCDMDSILYIAKNKAIVLVTVYPLREPTL